MNKLAATGVALVLVVTACGLGGLALGTTSAVTSSGCALAAGAGTPGATPSATAQPPTEALDRWDPQQVEHATTIVTVGQQLDVPPRGWVIALATAMQESGLRNLGHQGEHNDHDSLGLFQQRPSQGWGNPQQIMDPAHAAEAFYDALAEVDGWQQMPLTRAAQEVQKSAFPDAYAKWEADAVALAAAITGVTPQMLTLCGAGGWVEPVDGPVVSGFRVPNRPDHDGVDIAAARGTTIRAAHAGTVVVATCNVIPTGWGCDRDGNPDIRGCGWYVDIVHSGGIRTRYCHMLEQPLLTVGEQVAAGQPIGLVGTSGNSSGPHLHYEVHMRHEQPNNRPEVFEQTDPVAFHAQIGVPLG